MAIATASKSKLIYIDEKNKKSTKREFSYSAEQRISIAACQQPTLEALTSLIGSLPGKKIYVVDLRQENHFFVSGLPVSVSNNKNDANRNKNLEEIERRENLLIQKIRQKALISPLYEYEKIAKDAAGSKKNRHSLKALSDIAVDRTAELFTEKELVSKIARAAYVRVPITDHGFPTAENIDQLVQIHDSLPLEEASVLAHCAAGKGRSSIVFAIFAILQMSKTGKTLDEIFTYIQALGNVTMLQPGEEPRRQRNDPIFWANFYAFAQARSVGMLWSRHISSTTI